MATTTDNSSSSSKAVLLITGAWHVPAHYSKLTAALEAKGLRVLAPTLPSNNNAVPATSTLAEDVALIRALVTRELANGTHLTVLVHSYGGVVATDALGDFLPPSSMLPTDAAGGGGGRIHQLIYMAAFVPFEGESLMGIFGGLDKAPPFITMDESLHTLGVTDPAHVFYNDCAAEDIDRALGLLVAHPIAAQTSEIACAKAAWRDVPVSYLVCEEDAAIPAAVQEMMIGRVRQEGVEVREFRIKAGHSPFLSMPEQVVDVVVEVL